MSQQFLSIFLLPFNKKPASVEDGGREIRILNFAVSVAFKNKNIEDEEFRIFERVRTNVCVLQVSHKGGESSCMRRASLGATNFGVHSKSPGYYLETKFYLHS